MFYSELSKVLAQVFFIKRTAHFILQPMLLHKHTKIQLTEQRVQYCTSRKYHVLVLYTKDYFRQESAKQKTNSSPKSSAQHWMQQLSPAAAAASASASAAGVRSKSFRSIRSHAMLRRRVIRMETTIYVAPEIHFTRSLGATELRRRSLLLLLLAASEGTASAETASAAIASAA